MRISLTRPDDWHLHLRDQEILSRVLPHTARQFGRAIIMPNLRPPVCTTAQALAYRERILAALPHDRPFRPLMTLYLTDNTRAEEVRRASDSGEVVAVKLYPAGATTHSDAGVTDLARTGEALEAMADAGLPLLVHGEVTDPDVDVFDREAVFIERHLVPLVELFPTLKIVLEHVTTREGVAFVRETPDTVAATITAHHLMMNRNAMFRGGMNPHHYCLPVLKRETHRQALLAAATSGSHKFFLGTDSAPHTRDTKETACGCAGIYTAHAAIELYAQAFEAEGALDRLEGFASFHGPDFYGLPRNPDTITLVREEWTVPDSYPLGDTSIIPLCAGQVLHWRLAAPSEDNR